MHLSPLVLASLLSSLAVVSSADQVPLKELASAWLDKAKSFIPSGNVAPSIPNPIDAGAAKVADKRVQRINIRNWQRILAPKPEGEEEWMVYMTGGNKSCYGRCGPVDLVWNESIPLLAALPISAGSPPLYLGTVDCEREDVLCTAWAASMPSIYHFQFPQKADPQPKTPLHIIPLNISTTTAADIVSIPTASKARYLEVKEYTGVVHPVDGLLHKFNLLMPLGYVLCNLSSTPSWLLMIGISFVSRQIMSRRMGNRPGLGAGNVEPPQPPAGLSRGAPPPAAAPKAGAAGGKKRK